MEYCYSIDRKATIWWKKKTSTICSFEKEQRLPSTSAFIVVTANFNVWLNSCLVSCTAKNDAGMEISYAMMSRINCLMLQQSPQLFWKMKKIKIQNCSKSRNMRSWKIVKCVFILYFYVSFHWVIFYCSGCFCVT